ISRAMGVIAETYHDDKGIIWPNAVAPYQVHLIYLGGERRMHTSRMHTSEVRKLADEIYNKLQKEKIEVLYDDRELSAGEKFADADLIGIPVRLVVSEKTGRKVEFKKRSEEKTELLSFDQVIKRLN
ncbi:MAG: His/Gly/Thr/Pro-type tRNA ligase C-terminal domain-containing protein, partial [Candidatus Pacearchaeota archaeon]